MNEFIQELLQFHGNGKHKSNWANLKESFRRNRWLVEKYALEMNDQMGSTLLHAAHNISSSLCASLIVTLMLTYQMEFLCENKNDLFVSEVLQIFDYITPQEAECASQELALLAHTVTRLACEGKCPAKVIPSLSRLSSTVSPSPTCLTAIHADILQACISGKMYSFAHDFISDTSILEINPKKSFLETSDFLKYFYYSGIVFIAVKDFKRALESFDEVLSFPADKLSAVCIDAYKRAVLVSLIQNGKVYSIPSNASRVVKKLGVSTTGAGDFADIGIPLKPYRLIEKQFTADGNLPPMLLSDEHISATVAMDGNTGLMKQVLEAFVVHRIKRISESYMSISLTKLAVLVSGDRYTPEDIEKKLIKMNNKGLTIAKINNSTGVVTFFDLSSKFQDSPQFALNMQAQLTEAGVLSDYLRSMHRDVLTCDKYLKKNLVAVLGKSEGAGMGGTGVAAAYHDMDMDTFDFE